MCGIAGISGRPNSALLRKMMKTMRHRGPDGQNAWVSAQGFALGHNRLAIIDVAGGTQPIANENGTMWMAMNGEIYNHMALRRELETRHTFRTQSDSEVALHLYEEEGPAFVRRLDGMFAIAIWGAESGLYLARDPLGIKPLYYGYGADGNLLFASEIKAVIDEVPRVEELPAGSYWRPGDQPVTYYTVPEPAVDLTNEDAAVDALDRTLTDAVIKRLMADVPLGLFLSGGLDSSLIAAIARLRVHGPLHSFAVGLAGSADLLNARIVAKTLGTMHHERVLAPTEILGALPKVIDSLESCDPALVRSALPTYFVSELASQYVKVVLSGEGADELFSGYQYLSELAEDSDALSDELRLITRNLHNSNLQRVDRITMAHGLEGRVPFLDVRVVDLAFRMHPALKWRDGQGKWVVRKVAERYLPPAIAWREKEKFAIGTGIGPLLEQYAADVVGDAQPGWGNEAWLYWSLFRNRYGRSDILENMGSSRSLNPTERWVSMLPSLS